MGLLLSVETGDVTSAAKAIRKCLVESDRPPVRVRLSLADVAGEIPFAEWPLLVEQVKAYDHVKRFFPDGLQPPMRTILDVLRQITSTPTYHLFLAGIDISERIYLVSEASAETVKNRFKSLDKWMPSVTGAGGLFFVPASMLSGYSEQAVQDLLCNNKLCAATFGDLRRFYIPYATPIDFLVPVGREAENLWDEVRASYYAFRQPA